MFSHRPRPAEALARQAMPKPMPSTKLCNISVTFGAKKCVLPGKRVGIYTVMSIRN